MRATRCIGFAASVLGAGFVIGAEPQPQGAVPPPGQPPEARRGDERRARMFDEIDANKDGQISREEFTARRFRGDGQGRGGPGQGGEFGNRQPLGGPRGEGPGQGGDGDRRNRRGGAPMFGMLDTNRDGNLQTAEIQRVVDIFQKALEASRQGDLTPEDWREMAEQLRPAEDRGPRPQGAPGGFGGQGQGQPRPQ